MLLNDQGPHVFHFREIELSVNSVAAAEKGLSPVFAIDVSGNTADAFKPAKSGGHVFQKGDGVKWMARLCASQGAVTGAVGTGTNGTCAILVGGLKLRDAGQDAGHVKRA